MAAKATAKGGKGGAAAKAKADAVAKASKTARGLKAPSRTSSCKVRHRLRFYRPKTLCKPRTPRAPRLTKFWKVPGGEMPYLSRKHKYSVVLHPLTTESSMKKIEENNSLVFLCDPRASKPAIKEAVRQLYGVGVRKVNTLIRMDGKKKAYVRLEPEFDALDVANKLGII